MAYGYYRAITIDHTKVPGNLTNHPFLFNTTHNDLRTVGNGGHVTSASGYDIVFSPNPDGSSRYDHEIEKYVTATGECVIHVRIPAISSTIDTVFYIVYGDSGVTTSQENITGVWDSNFKMVQHLNGANVAACDDSTSNNNDMAAEEGDPTYQQAGKIGYGIGYDGTGDVNEYTASVGSSTQTWEVWIKFPTESATQIMWAERKSAAANPITGQIYTDGAGKLQGIVRDDAGNLNISTTAGTYDDNAWHYAVLVRNGNSVELFVDNASAGADASSAIGTITVDKYSLAAYWNATFLDYRNLLAGLLDEARASNIVRSSDYITATYNNQNSPGTFYDIQAAEQIARSPRSGVTFASCIGVV